jgi:hypothetical protein
MIPALPEEELKLFHKYLNGGTVYFEFGCGGSTYVAAQKKNIKKIIAVDSHVGWINKVKEGVGALEGVSDDKLVIEGYDMNAKKFGYPGDDYDPELYKLYPRTINKYRNDGIDVVLIDGRFRVACALYTYFAVSDECIILFDDYLTRPEYHMVEKYYDIIETGGRMAVMRKKRGDHQGPDQLTLKKQERIAR